MKYLIMVYTNPSMREFWENLSDDERREAAQGHKAVQDALIASGELISSAALQQDPMVTRRVAVKDGAVLTTDGPFAEVKEHLAGFYYVECESEERALEWASKMPEADMGLVELRPINDLSAYGLT